LETGEPCMESSECASRSCVDNVCCQGACSDACDVCSKANGADADGVCTPDRSLRSECGGKKKSFYGCEAAPGGAGSGGAPLVAALLALAAILSRARWIRG